MSGPRPRTILARPRYGPLVGALVPWVLSMWPTLLPRGVVVQGCVSGVCAALGWLTGLVAGHAVHHGLAAIGRPVSPAVRRVAWRLLAVLAPVVAVIALVQWYRWQNEQRRSIGMPEIPFWWVVPVTLVSIVVLAVLVLIGRLVVAGVMWIDRRVERVVPRWWARLAIGVVLVLVVVGALNIGKDRIVSWADTSFGAVNETSPDGIGPPRYSGDSGSAESLVPWDTLGFQGRTFAGGGPGAEDIAVLNPDAGPGGTAVEPIRVYVGLDSADSVEARTDLAMRELERSGAFDRDVLVVWTATGTGWVNPDAARAIEIMHGGNTAIVSVQYSFLPSWIAFLVDPDNAAEAGISLFDAVQQRWADLPADDRPELIVYGESLGSQGGERAFSGDGQPAQESLEEVVAETDGALFVGPVASNAIYGRMVDERDRGSPSWRPALAAVPELRVANAAGEIDADDTSWTSPRILYLHHPTDAVGTWSPAALWRPPGWTEHPVGRGVPGRVRWFPVVTWVQETADLMAGFSAKTGYGHDYN
ncbi:MAG TPA: alpha/beta-hydrolase family protein, partial [Ilumatobacteraceae bacterium]|nr:alpha/beta-hydrolase family protein [Ilumatobacteraceae bacterium]